MLFDLHSHSTASDGTLSPTALVKRASEQGVQVLALTDHDTTAGLAEARQAAGTDLNLINGIEVSVSWNGQAIHIVGLGLDPDNAALQTGLVRLGEFRQWRAEEIARRLEKKRIPGAFEGAMAYAKGELLSRTHFARFLVEKGYADSVGKVFKHYLVQGKPGYVPGKWAGLEEAVGWIKDAGGLAVVAHPARYRISATRLRALLGEFRECGGLAMEVVSGSHSKDDCLSMAAHAKRQQLLASQGSDYHGPENPWIELGRLRDMPEGCLPIWESEHWPAAGGGDLRP
ncbi:PHP domain-containing protein [Sulfuriflexus mobilis]|uniref:PHP domain-containing protein n=1 Tax=Sulfuriflexus mobilis TaxID=1811807 RepID=UPI000F837491|nr:PHP domain-containing protein [Sulfuriflexus mobilis]